MSRFNEVTYNAEEGTATVGMGLTWDVVYNELQQYNVSVVGGRAPGVGVGGFSLGGGRLFMIIYSDNIS
jgi:FAD/FMN-containing dehydrogenase